MRAGGAAPLHAVARRRDAAGPPARGKTGDPVAVAPMGLAMLSLPGRGADGSVCGARAAACAEPHPRVKRAAFRFAPHPVAPGELSPPGQK
ncbi:hypothetical protein GCM10020221_25070 [Streptomyces thioluteus]|uniref:Uncharacterized protein n=1 Tax=Streptomyces thioluteus TaxID=66431 RepID=A0ABN3WWK8_STRTU